MAGLRWLARPFRALRRPREEGQALVLFAAGLVAFLGLVALSIDVGRFLWARTQIQAAVDASALAAAQSMPSTSDAATKATEYWLDNSGFIRSQGQNVQFNLTYPPGNKTVAINAQADIPTWFARIFGINSWHVSAEGEAESQVLDIALVLDISGSMCWGSYPPTNKGGPSGPFGPYVGPGRTANQVRLTSPIGTGTGSSITINVNNTGIFNSTNAATNNTNFGYSTTTRYYQYTPGNGRRGLVKIDDEVFLITAVPTATTLTVTRAQPNSFLGTGGAQQAHATNAVLWAQRADCIHSAPASSGPYDYYDGMIDDAQYFTTLFDSVYDKIGLATYSSAGTLRRNLTSDFDQVRTDMDAINNPNGGTNSAHGIALGRQVVDGAGKRANAVRVVVFLTDGRANAYCGAVYNPANYNTTSCPGQGSGLDGNFAAVSAAIAETQRLVDEDVVVYTIGFGPYVSDSFLQQVADGGVSGEGPCQESRPGCRYYKAPTLAELQAAFTSIAAQTHIALVK
jgi:Mg-chelatase subunit ChlD